jgi:hypothetical protein
MDQDQQPSYQLFDADLLRSKLATRELAMLDLLEEGDPFPLIRFEWPELIITDMEERAEFAKHLERKDNLDLRLDDFQVDAIRSVFDNRHTQLFVSGATKLGKGFTVGGLIVNIWFERFTNCKIILIGPNNGHVRDNLFGEAKTWRLRMSSYKMGISQVDVQKERIEEIGKDSHFIKIVNTESGEGLSGYHSYDSYTNAPCTLICVDEASGCPENYYNDALSQVRFFIAISNPRAPSGWFYRAYAAAKTFESGIITQNSSTGPRRLQSIGLMHCVNVKANRLSNRISPPKGIHVRGRKFAPGEFIPDEFTKDIKPLIPGQGTLDIFQSVEETKDREWRAYGRFPKTGSEFEIYGSAWPRILGDKWIEKESLITARAVGVDVGASKRGDPSCFVFGDNVGIKEIVLEKIQNQAELQGAFAEICLGRGLRIYEGMVPIGIDYTGVGKGLADNLEKDGAWVIKVEFGAAAERDKMQYMNRRAEICGEFADAIDPEMNLTPWLIPNDSYAAPLWEELFAHEKVFTGKPGQYRLNDKRKKPTQKSTVALDNRQSVEEKIGRSSDRADAAWLLFQAVRELPEFGDNLVRQFDPAMEVKDVYRDKQSKLVQVLYWSGKEETISEELYEAKFGKDFQSLGSVNWAEELRKSVIAGR